MKVFTSVLVTNFVFARGFEQRGVAQSRQEKFSADDFQCDVSRVLKREYINDNYCDCDDGTDEPGTSACSNIFPTEDSRDSLLGFYCVNKGHRGKYIPGSRVDDDLCDCCDGSDEGVGTCQDTCLAASEAAHAANRKRIDRLEIGSKKREEYVERGKNEAERRMLTIRELETKVETLEGKSKMLEAEKAPLEEEQSKVRAALQAKSDELILQIFPGVKDLSLAELRSLLVRFARKVDPGGKILYNLVTGVEDKDDRDNIDYHEYGDDNDWVDEYDHYDEELYAYGDYSGSMSSTEEIDGNDHYETDPLTEDSRSDADEDTYFRDSNEVSTHTVESSDNKISYELDIEETSYELEFESDMEGQDEVENKFGSEDSDLLAEEDISLPDPPELAEKRAAFDSVNVEIKDLRKQIIALKDDKNTFFGLDNEFFPLKGQCFKHRYHEHTYEMCPYGDAHQKEKESSHKVGSWSGLVYYGRDYTKGNNSHERDAEYLNILDNPEEIGLLPEDPSEGVPGIAMKFDDGDYCQIGGRSAMVSLRCGISNELVEVEEPRVCEYIMVLETPAACPQLLGQLNFYGFEEETLESEL